LGSSQALPILVLRERQRHQRYLEHRMKQLRREARRLIERDPELDRRYRLMLTVPGIGETSALQILGELVVLSATTDARQWVACSGLDPAIFASGTSVEKRPRIGPDLCQKENLILKRESALLRFSPGVLSRHFGQEQIRRQHEI
jgi:Transposase IS116/IS110/IS902 family